MNIPNPLKAVVVQEDLGDVQTSSDIFNPMSRPKYQVIMAAWQETGCCKLRCTSRAA